MTVVTARPESEILTAILAYLRARGVWAERRNSRVLMLPGKGGRLRPVRFGGVKGASDIVGCLPTGRFLAIEVKRPGQQATLEQAAYLAEVRRHGGLAFVAHSLTEVEEALR